VLNLILASSIENLKIASLEDGIKIADVDKVLIDPENGKFIGLTIIKFLSKKNKIISSRDILSIDKEGVVTNSQKDIVDIDEIAGTKETLKNPLLGCKVRINKNYIGKVIDVSLSLETMSAVNIYVRSVFKERIVPISRIDKYDKKSHTLILKGDNFAEASVVWV